MNKTELLKQFRSKGGDPLFRLVTVNEIWVHDYEPENKAQNGQWIGPSSPRLKILKIWLPWKCYNHEAQLSRGTKRRKDQEETMMKQASHMKLPDSILGWQGDSLCILESPSSNSFGLFIKGGFNNLRVLTSLNPTFI